MHYYQFNIADFNDATMHCTRLERAIYRDALDLYYKTERPLNGCSNRLQRLLRIEGDIEQEALEFVLAEFFLKTGEGYENKRCEEEITQFKENKSNSAIAGQVSGLSREIKGLVAKAKRQINDLDDVSKATDVVTELRTSVERALNSRSEFVRNMFEQNANKNEPTKELKNLITKYIGDSDESPPPPAKFNFKTALIDLGVDSSVASDYLKVRSKKKASNTEIAFKRIKTEIIKSGLPANDAITRAVERSWSGFEASWLESGKPKQSDDRFVVQ